MNSGHHPIRWARAKSAGVVRQETLCAFPLLPRYEKIFSPLTGLKQKEEKMSETKGPECGAETSGGDAGPACGETLEAKPTDDRPLNVIDAKAIVVKVMWGTGALMLCGGLGALSIGAAKPAVGLLGLGGLLFAGSYAVDWWT